MSEKISIDKMEGLYKNAEQDVELCDGVIVKVKRTIPLDDAIHLAEYIAGSVVDGDSGEYTPEIFEFAKRTGVIMYYTNIKLPENVDDQYMFVFDTDVYYYVGDVINDIQLESIVEAAQEKIDFILDVISSTAIMKVSELVDAVGNMIHDAGETFSGLSEEDIKKFVQNVGSLDKPDEAVLAKEVMNIQEAKKTRKGRTKKDG